MPLIRLGVVDLFRYSTEEMETLIALRRHPGWPLLQRWITQQAQQYTAALVRDDLTIPTRAARIQGRIEALADIDRHLDFVEEQYRKRMEAE